MQIFLLYIRCELHFLKSNDFKPHLYLMDLRLSWIVGTVDHQTQTGYFCPRVQLTKKDCVVGLVHRTLFLQLKANFTCDSLRCPLLCGSVASSDSLCACIPFEKCRHQGDRAPKMGHSSPNCQVIITWGQLMLMFHSVSQHRARILFWLVYFHDILVEGGSIISQTRSNLSSSHQQMESEMFRLFLQAPLKVLHLLNQIWMWCFFVLNDPFKLL